MVELVSKRYGEAIFDLAVETNQVERLEQEVKMIRQLFEQEAELSNLLSHPNISRTERIHLVEEIFSERVSQEMVGLLVLIIRKGRQNQILDILAYVEELIDGYKDYLTAHVTTAVELDRQTIESIQNKLESQTGKKIRIAQKVDTDLIGGLSIRIKDRIVDSSVKSTFHIMARRILGE